MKILIADDHPLTLQGTKSFVQLFGYTVIDTCSNGIAALNLINLHVPDIAILDIDMPGMDGLDVAEKILLSKLKTKIVLLTMHKEMTVYERAKEIGVFGYVLKEHAQNELEDCLKKVALGNEYVSAFLDEELINNSSLEAEMLQLTFSEKKILELIKIQKTNKQIAQSLFLSERTIEGHRRNIIEKLGLAKEKNSLLKWAIQSHSK